MLWELKLFKYLFNIYLFFSLVYQNPILAKGNHLLVKSEIKTKSQVFLDPILKLTWLHTGFRRTCI